MLGILDGVINFSEMSFKTMLFFYYVQVRENTSVTLLVSFTHSQLDFGPLLNWQLQAIFQLRLKCSYNVKPTNCNL